MPITDKNKMYFKLGPISVTDDLVGGNINVYIAGRFFMTIDKGFIGFQATKKMKVSVWFNDPRKEGLLLIAPQINGKMIFELYSGKVRAVRFDVDNDRLEGVMAIPDLMEFFPSGTRCLSSEQKQHHTELTVFSPSLEKVKVSQGIPKRMPIFEFDSEEKDRPIFESWGREVCRT